MAPILDLKQAIRHFTTNFTSSMSTRTTEPVSSIETITTFLSSTLPLPVPPTPTVTPIDLIHTVYAPWTSKTPNTELSPKSIPTWAYALIIILSFIISYVLFLIMFKYWTIVKTRRIKKEEAVMLKDMEEGQWGNFLLIGESLKKLDGEKSDSHQNKVGRGEQWFEIDLNSQSQDWDSNTGGVSSPVVLPAIPGKVLVRESREVYPQRIDTFGIPFVTSESPEWGNKKLYPVCGGIYK